MCCGAEVEVSWGVEPGQTIVANVADSAFSPVAGACCLELDDSTSSEAGTRPELASCVEDDNLKDSSRAAEIASWIESAFVAACTRAPTSGLVIESTIAVDA